MICHFRHQAFSVSHDRYTAAQTTLNQDIATELRDTFREHTWMLGHRHVESDPLPEIAGKAFAVMRYSESDFEPVGYVAGLAENAGTWKVILDRATALEQSDRLNDADDGCYYLAEQYTGE